MRNNRVAGLLLKDGKLLLVTGYEEEIYWTPGGKKDSPNEDDITALSRELNEELGIKLLNADFYTEYEHPSRDGKRAATKAYLVKWSGDIKPQSEITRANWFSKKDYDDHESLISSGARESLFPKLIRDKLVV